MYEFHESEYMYCECEGCKSEFETSDSCSLYVPISERPKTIKLASANIHLGESYEYCKCGFISYGRTLLFIIWVQTGVMTNPVPGHLTRYEQDNSRSVIRTPHSICKDTACFQDTMQWGQLMSPPTLKIKDENPP